MRQSSLGICLGVWVLLLAATGCGSLDMDFVTEVDSSGVVTQKVTFEGTEQLGSLLVNPETARGYREEGWEVQLNRDADVSRLSASKIFGRPQDITLPDIGSDEEEISLSGFFDGVTFEPESRGLYRYYSLEVAIPPQEDIAESPGSSDDGSEQFGEELAQLIVQSVSLSWGIRLPGKVTETNADSEFEGMATWEFDLTSLEKGRTLRMESRELNKQLVTFIATGAVLLMLVGIVTVVMVRRRKPSQLASP